jgi:hypothetical protein
MSGADLDIAGLAGLRLGEHALHTWDIAVALDPAATLLPRTGGDADVTFPAEAFIRLVAGRLDPDHTPLGVDAGDRLDQLWQAFPDF